MPPCKFEYPDDPEKQAAIDLIDGKFRDSILEIIEAIPDKQEELGKSFVNQAWKAYVLAMSAFGQDALPYFMLYDVDLPDLYKSTLGFKTKAGRK